jgi:transcriptional regulator with XRE-family HTH domain
MQEGIGKGPIVTPKKFRQKRAIRLLLSGLTTTQVAERLGVDQKTILTWLERPRLADRVARLEAERDARFQRRTLALLWQAALTLERMLKSRNCTTVMFAIRAILKLNARLPQIRQRFEYLRLRDNPPPFIKPRAWQGPQSN